MTIAPRPQASLPPLVVDLDGTLIVTDTLVESVLRLVKRSPAALLGCLPRLAAGRAALKRHVAAHAQLSAALLPYRPDLLAYLHEQKAAGRSIILATAADRSVAEDVASHLGLFDAVLASDGELNLKGAAKLEAIRAQVGPAFVYAGDSTADRPIWQAAEGAILAGVPAGQLGDVRREATVEREFPPAPAGPGAWRRALRLHQWAKNLLLFVPLLTAFTFTPHSLAAVLGAFVAFSLAASATYIGNDLLDLESDRAHPRKRFRPFASGQIPILRGAGVAAALLLAAALLGLAVSPTFLLMLAGYVVLTVSYSLALKTRVFMDVLMLGILYTFRIMAGSVAMGVATSSWLLAFSIFLFLSLALVKRCAELRDLAQAGRSFAHGRDYRVEDLVVLWPLGIGAALSALVVFGLFINAPETQARYATPNLLWLAGLALLYWLGRVWIKTARGEMHDDPVVFAIKDRGSRAVALFMVVTMLVAHYAAFGQP